MKQRHIILIGFILPGLVGVLLEWSDSQTSKLLERYLGNYWMAVPLIYMLLLGVLAGLEISRFFQPGNPPTSFPATRKSKSDRRPFDRQYRDALYNTYRVLVPAGVQNQQHKLEHGDIFEPPLLTINQLLSVPLPIGSQIDTTTPRDIWYHLNIPGRPRLFDRFRTDRRQRHFVILGLPGVGKSSLLHHIALIFVRKQHLIFNPPLRELTPILLVLREHIGAIKQNPHVDISQLITFYSRHHLELAKATVAWFVSQLRSGRCIVLIDGLDEIADARDRQLVAEWVQTQIKRWSTNYVVITSRPYGYVNNQLIGVRVLEVESFTAPQIESFVHKWYLATEIKMTNRNDEGVCRQAKKQAEDLIVRMTYKRDFSKLASNPLLLTMIATVHRYLLKLPEKRAELYKEIFEVFLSRRQTIVDDLVTLQKLRVLGPLAYRMMLQRDPQIEVATAVEVISAPLAEVSQQAKPELFLKRIEESSGLLLEVGPGIYKFAHLTYQEYLASVYILRQHNEKELINYIDDVWWHETILLAAAQEDASDVLEATLRYAGHSEQALSLGITLLDEAISLRPEVRNRFLDYLEANVEQGQPQQRTLIAEALLRYNQLQMVLLDDRKQRSIGSMLISHPAYQRFLDVQQVQGRAFFPDHWRSNEFPPGTSKQPALGVRLHDAIAFCVWLTERDRDGMSYRLPTSDESKNYQAGLDSRMRYWVTDGSERIYGERWTTPPDRVRAILADHLFDDVNAMQIFALILLVEQVRIDARELGDWYGREMLLSNEIMLAGRLEAYGVVMDALTQAIGRLHRDATLNLANQLAQVALTIQDKAKLAVERYTQAQAAAKASTDARDEDRKRAYGKLVDELRGEAREPIRMISDILKLIHEDLSRLRAILPAGLYEGGMVATRLQEVVRQAGMPAFRAIALPVPASQDEILAEVREHLHLIEITRLPELARAGYLGLDATYAAEYAQVFDRAGMGRPACAVEERLFLRYWSLISSLIWVSRDGAERGDWTRDQRAQGIRCCRRIYIDLLLLDERIAGRMPPVEGIRLVRELQTIETKG